MRIISQDRMIDIPYDRIAVYIDRRTDKQIYVSNVGDDEGFLIGTYNSKEDAVCVMKLIKESFLLDCSYFFMPDAKKDAEIVSSCSDKGGEQE